MDGLTGFSDTEIEQAAVSCLMQWPEPSFALVEAHGITAEHFQTPANRVLFDCLRNHFVAGKPIELISFTHDLRALGILDSVGGPYYVTHTWCNTCYSQKILGYYLEIIEEAHAKRVLAVTCGESASQAALPGVEGEPLVIETIEQLERIPLPSRHKNKTQTLADAVDEKLARLSKGEVDEDILPTGLIELDQKSPLRRGDMPLIAGARKAGKSILALSIALSIARRGFGVAYFSLEDRKPKLMDRIFANVSRISMNNRGAIPSESAARDAAAEIIRSLPLYIVDDVSDLGRIVAISVELKARKDVGLIVVDYGQLVVPPERRDSNREQKVAEVSRTLRLLAMKLDTPLILLSQLNDAGLTRESRALEQDATAMWRVDLCESPRKHKGDQPVYERGQRSIHIPWQRNGESGVGFKVAFIGDQARVENIAQEDDF